MAVRITSQEAKAFVTARINNGQELPRDIDFGSSSNHLASALIFIAMGEPGQVFNLRQVHSAFRVRTPKAWETEGKQNKGYVRHNAHLCFDSYEEDARERLEEGKSATILDGIQFASANQWKVDNDITTTFAVNSKGIAVAVMDTIGWPDPDDNSLSAVANWERVQQDLERNIDRTEF